MQFTTPDLHCLIALMFTPKQKTFFSSSSVYHSIAIILTDICGLVLPSLLISSPANLLIL